jgi:transcription elongation GreA/GreB family factor
MSRAFVKEPEGDAAEPLPERPISQFHNYVTARGLRQIEAAVAELQSALADATGHDDPLAARKIARDLNYWKARRASAELVNPPQDASTVRFGSKVTLNAGGRRQTFRIVGEDEADPKHGFLSYVAPLARELIGKELGETVSTPGGEAEIIAIETGNSDRT